MRRLTIKEHIELLKHDRESYNRLREIDPDKAKSLARERLIRMGFINNGTL